MPRQKKDGSPLMSMRALLIGDIVGAPGREIMLKKLPALREKMGIDFCIANGENTSGGSGITKGNTRSLLKAGVDVVTLGDHCWKRKEIIPFIEEEPRLLRPYNYSPYSAGNGIGVYTLPGGCKIAVILLVGRVFMRGGDCPFRMANQAIELVAGQTSNIFVEIHAEATAEKVAIGWHMDGRATAVFGTHTHVQTADERLLNHETAFICDLGMTGPHESVLGRRVDRVIKANLTQMPYPFDVAKDDVRISGACVTFDETTGRASAIERVVVHESDDL
jgi:2',3'-cyclic-nucleotide 2'-phosphodiesterase